MKPKNDPLVKAVRHAQLNSAKGKLETLLAEERRWRRKLTIASGKLADVRERLNNMAVELATKADATPVPESDAAGV